MRLLLLTSNLPWPMEMHGGAQRTALLLEALRSVADVDIAYVCWLEESIKALEKTRATENRIVGKFYVSSASAAQASSFVRLPIVGRTFKTVHKYMSHYWRDPQFAGWLDEVVGVNQYDGVISRYLWPGAVGGVAELRGVRKLLDWDDLDHLKVRSQIAVEPWKGLGGAVATPLVLSRLKRFCLAQSASYDHVWVAKPDDVAPSGARSVSVLPNIPFDLKKTRSAVTRDRSVLFVGNLRYLPNSNALSKFLDEAWPRIHHQCPGARVLAVGPPPRPDVEARWRAFAGVEIVGAVPSLAPYYNRASLSICPVQWGGGSNVKVIESLGYGVPCVVSPYSFAGFRRDFDSDTGMICAESVDDTVEACIALLNDPERSAALGLAGSKVVEARYSRKQFQKVVVKGLVQAGLSVDRP